MGKRLEQASLTKEEIQMKPMKRHSTPFVIRETQNKLYFEPNSTMPKVTIFFLKHLKICPVYFLRQNSRPTNARVIGMILVRSGEESMQAV